MSVDSSEFLDGEVYYIPNYPYEDGGNPTPKLIIIIGADAEHVHEVKTTSRNDKYEDYPPGCYARSRFYPAYYIEKENKERFDKDTFVQINTVKHWQISQLETLEKTLKFKLSQQCFNSIIDCIEQYQQYKTEIAKTIKF